MRVGERNAAIDIDDDHALARAFDGICEPSLRRAALCYLAIHHRPNVVAHDGHGREQCSELVRASAWGRTVQIAARDPLGDCGRGRDWAGNATSQQPSHQGREQKGDARSGQAQLPVRGYCRLRTLAVDETVASSEVNEQIHLLIGEFGGLLECSPVMIGRSARAQMLARGPPSLDSAACAGRSSCRARHCDRSAAIAKSSSNDFASASIFVVSSP